MWNAKGELAKRAVVIAREKHPDGFNKKQLAECGSEVFGGFGETQVRPMLNKKIETMEDVGNMGNAMAFIDGRYPVGMSGCYVVGINGGCGLECPVYLEGDCDNTEEFYDDLTGDDLRQHIEIYGEQQLNEQ